MRTTILLCLVTKNDEKVVERCLDSCRLFTEGVCIYDIESTDETLSKIKEKTNSLISLSMNPIEHLDSTIVLEMCVKFATENKHDLSKTYALLLSPDMTIEPGSESEHHLIDFKYSIRIKKGELVSYETRLFRLDQSFKNLDLYSAGTRLNSLKVVNHNDSPKIEKSKRELSYRCLSRLGDESSYFLLGQLYKDLGNTADSLKTYLKMHETFAESKSEKVWYAMIQIARIFRERKNEPEMVNAYLNAYNYRPSRAETLWELSNYYRGINRHQLVVIMAQLAQTISYPHNDNLFINEGVYLYQCDVELSISSYYTLEKTPGYHAADRLLTSTVSPTWVKNMTLSNIIYYLPKIGGEIVDISIPLPEKYLPLNPSMVLHEDKIYGCIRSVNYTQTRGNYQIKDEDKKVRTRNYFVELSHNGEITSQREIIDTASRQMWDHGSIGVEDVRLFRYRRNWWFTCTAVQDTAEWGRRRIGMGRLELNQESNTYEFNHFVVLRGDFIKDIEKNWLPFVQDDELYLIYNTSPFTIIKPNEFTGECTIVSKKEYHRDLWSLRGSAPPIPYKDGYIYVTHEVAWVNWRTYFHRIVTFNKNFEITRVSQPFIFTNLGVEFCISILYNDGQFKFGVGIEDGRASIISISEEKMESLFNNY